MKKTVVMLPSDDRLLKVPELCSLLSLSRASVYRLIRAGELPIVRVAGVIRFRHKSILKWMEDRETAALSKAA
jgi:excisionase family DNA binding protein